MDRFDLFRTIHKGIRRILFETAQAVGRTDFADAGEAAAAAAAVERMLGFLEEHADHEDAVVLPELAALAPELYLDLRDDHARTLGLQRELGAVAARLETAGDCGRVSLGRRIEDRLGRLVAAHLNHLVREEVEANRVLWAHRDDAALSALQERIVASIEPSRLSDWYALTLPAVSAPERRAVLDGLRATLTGARFDRITAAARNELGEGAWTDSATPANASRRLP